MNTCQHCQHWQPLFSGEHWGVRSFADAPQAEQDAILQKLANFYKKNSYFAAEKALGMDIYIDMYVEKTIKDWPMWGACQLTDLENSDKPTLAKAIDGSNYMAILHCRANFGCIQFQQL